MVYVLPMMHAFIQRIALFACCFWPALVLYAQDHPVNRGQYIVHVSPLQEEMHIDGILDEPAWEKAEPASRFHRVLPTDTGYAAAQTEVRLLADENFLYIGVICFDPLPGPRPVESLRRDFAFGNNDNFIAFIDPYNDQTNGFAFGVSAAGAQWDGIQANGGFVSLEWDTKWKSAVKNYTDRWTAEMAIPFRSIRYIKGDTVWGINFSRLDLKTNEKSTWAPVPRQFQTANLAYTGTLVWPASLPAPGIRFSLIPYALVKASSDREAGKPTSYSVQAGADAKLMLSTSLNLDITVNPDFSQVEVDQQRTNLDRFELFFPEKRQFFLENSDIFASLGEEKVRPFFSRRIGLENPIAGGMRLSGKLSENWRLGLMDIQTVARDEFAGANFGVAVLQRKLFSRSNITAFVINREVTDRPTDSSFTGNSFNRVGGLEYNLASADNRWTGKAYYHHSLYSGANSESGAASASLTFENQFVKATLAQTWVGRDYLAEVGYVQRTGYYLLNPSLQYKFFPPGGRVANHGFILAPVVYFTPSFSVSDRNLQAKYFVEMMNKQLFYLQVNDMYIRLQAPFDPTHTGGDSLATGSSYHWNEVSAGYSSDLRKPLNAVLSVLYGGFYNGSRFSVEGQLNFRIQPYARLAMTGAFNSIVLPAPYNSANLLLLGPKVDITFTDKLFLTTFLQYNNQIDNLNLNIRFQYRFAPVSDFYLVYTDNTWPENFRNKSRGVVAKLSYWFN